jgi:hypothetical protein
MPIAATQPLLQTQITSALTMGKAAQPNIVATQIASAVGTASTSGLLPAAPSPIPLTPSGLTAGQQQITSALTMGKGANKKAVATQMANGISTIAPLAPPSGLSTLQVQLESAMNLGKGAQPSIVATQFASAIVQYYLAGGII